MSEPEASDPRIPVRFFVSYAQHDRELVKDLLEELERQLAISAKFRYIFWQDRLIEIGADWKLEIEKALDEADFGLLFVSPSFLKSQFILRKELPRFLGPTKPCLPVGLKQLDFKLQDLKGLEEKQMFLWRLEERGSPKPYSSFTQDHGKETFAHELFREIERRLNLWRNKLEEEERRVEEVRRAEEERRREQARIEKEAQQAEVARQLEETKRQEEQIHKQRERAAEEERQRIAEEQREATQREQERLREEARQEEERQREAKRIEAKRCEELARAEEEAAAERETELINWINELNPDERAVYERLTEARDRHAARDILSCDGDEAWLARDAIKIEAEDVQRRAEWWKRQFQVKHWGRIGLFAAAWPVLLLVAHLQAPRPQPLPVNYVFVDLPMGPTTNAPLPYLTISPSNARYLKKLNRPVTHPVLMHGDDLDGIKNKSDNIRFVFFRANLKLLEILDDSVRVALEGAHTEVRLRCGPETASLFKNIPRGGYFRYSVFFRVVARRERIVTRREARNATLCLDRADL